MRNSNRRPRRRKPSRFERGGAGDNRDLIRFRRNRESLVREITVLILWGALVLLLIRLTGSLWTVAERHLADRSTILRLSLPAASVLAIGFALWRSRGSWAEILDIRREQTRLGRRLRESQLEDSDPS